jgi:hypothetical protein
VGIGTTFVVRIPLARTQAREPSAAVEA